MEDIEKWDSKESGTESSLKRSWGRRDSKSQENLVIQPRMGKELQLPVVGGLPPTLRRKMRLICQCRCVLRERAPPKALL